MQNFIFHIIPIQRKVHAYAHARAQALVPISRFFGKADVFPTIAHAANDLRFLLEFFCKRFYKALALFRRLLLFRALIVLSVQIQNVLFKGQKTLSVKGSRSSECLQSRENAAHEPFRKAVFQILRPLANEQLAQRLQFFVELCGAPQHFFKNRFGVFAEF